MVVVVFLLLFVCLVIHVRSSMFSHWSSLFGHPHSLLQRLGSSFGFFVVVILLVVVVVAAVVVVVVAVVCSGVCCYSNCVTVVGVRG